MILPVYLYGHPVIRKVAEPIDANYPDLAKLIADMYDTMYATDGIGLAAPQIGRSIRVVVIDVDPCSEMHPELAGVKMTLINPTLEVVEDGKKCSSEEGCLRIQGAPVSGTRRAPKHQHWYDENFVEHDEIIEGYLARVVQHECDHLEGKVFIDHLSPIRKQLIKAKVTNIIKGKINCGYRVKAAGTK